MYFGVFGIIACSWCIECIGWLCCILVYFTANTVLSVFWITLVVFGHLVYFGGLCCNLCNFVHFGTLGLLSVLGAVDAISCILDNLAYLVQLSPIGILGCILVNLVYLCVIKFCMYILYNCAKLFHFVPLVYWVQ